MRASFVEADPIRFAVAALTALFLISILITAVTINVIVRDSVERQARTDISRILTELDSWRPAMGPLAPIDAVDRRVAAGTTLGSGTILSIRRSNGEIIAGNIRQWPREIATNDFFRFRQPGVPDAILGRTKTFGGDFELLVGRMLRTTNATRNVLIGSLAILLTINLLLVLLIVRHMNQRLTGMVSTLSCRLDAAARGDYALRLAPVARPPFRRLARRIDILLARTESSIGAIRQLAANVAHELARPLNHAIGDAEAIVDYVSPSQKARADALLGRLDGMAQTFHGLLSLAEVEVGRAQQQSGRVDLADVAAEACEMYHDAAEEAGIVIRPDLSSATTFGERWMCLTAICNLLSNAIRHSPPDGTIWVTTRIAEQDAVVSVQDEGPGVDGLDLETLLAKLRSRSEEGKTDHALGLRLVRAIAFRHNATIDFIDRAGGLGVTIRFPCDV